MCCENCGKEHDGSYASGRFCCKSCAIAFGNKQRKLSEETKQKISNSIKKQFNQNIKLKKCSICGSLYEKNSKCNNSFCQQHNMQHFRSLIKYFGFNKALLGTKDVENEFNRIRNMLYDLYWNQHKSSTEIALMFNYKSTPTNITQKFFKNYLNIPVKDVKNSVIENYLQSRINMLNNSFYKSIWHTTWNNKEVYLRSSYELDYAKELDNKQIDYEVEWKHIKYWDSQKQEYRCAIPDFYIPSENLIVEIKSNWTLDKQNMKDKMKAYKDLGYNTKLICDHKELTI